MASQASSETKYDIDDEPLTNEMLEVLNAIEEKHQQTPTASSRAAAKGSARRRRRPSSTNPSTLITPTRLRGDPKPSERAKDAGITPKSSHTLRRDYSSKASSNTDRGLSAEARRSQSVGSAQASVDGLAGQQYYQYRQPGPPYPYTMVQHGPPHGAFAPPTVGQSYHPQSGYPPGAPQQYHQHQGPGYPYAQAGAVPHEYGQPIQGPYPNLPPNIHPYAPLPGQYDSRHETPALPIDRSDMSNRHPSALPQTDSGFIQSHHNPPAAERHQAAVQRETPALSTGRSESPSHDASNQANVSNLPTAEPRFASALYDSRRVAPASPIGRSESPGHGAIDQANRGSSQMRRVRHTDLPTDGPDAANDVFSPRYLPSTESHTSPSLETRSNIPEGEAPADGQIGHQSTEVHPHPRLLGSAKIPEPTFVVQPATPAAPAKSSAPSGFNERSPSSDVSMDDDEDEDPGYERLQESPTVGRLSTEKSDALKNGLAKIDALFKTLSVETGLSVPQIIDRWQLIQFRLPTLWNIYQRYFAENSEEELSRLLSEEWPRPGAIATKAHISIAYQKFKSANGKSLYGKKLQTWYQLHTLSTTDDMTMAQREREFSKFHDKIQNIGRHFSTRLGFELITIVVGSVINQDQNLGRMIMTPGAIDFFYDRFHTTDDIVLSHMKAHVYDRVSKRIMSGDNGQQSMQLPNGIKSTDASSSTQPQLLQPSKANGPSCVSSGLKSHSIQPVNTNNSARAASLVSSSVKAEASADVDLADADPETLENAQIVSLLKQKFEELGAKNDLAIVKATKTARLLQWKNLLQLTSSAGYVIINYPEGVHFPCDIPATTSGMKGSKGIAVLSRKALLALYAAFDHPTHPLKLEKRFDEAVPEDQPVVIGAPPDADSAHSFGRRKFLDNNLNEDRLGPPRLTSTGSSKRKGKATRKPSVQPAKRKRNTKAINDFIVESEEEMESVASYCPEEDDDDYEDDNTDDRSPKRLRSSTVAASKANVGPDDERKEGDDDEANSNPQVQPTKDTHSHVAGTGRATSQLRSSGIEGDVWMKGPSSLAASKLPSSGIEGDVWMKGSSSLATRTSAGGSTTEARVRQGTSLTKSTPPPTPDGSSAISNTLSSAKGPAADGSRSASALADQVARELFGSPDPPAAPRESSRQVGHDDGVPSKTVQPGGQVSEPAPPGAFPDPHLPYSYPPHQNWYSASHMQGWQPPSMSTDKNLPAPTSGYNSTGVSPSATSPAPFDPSNGLPMYPPGGHGYNAQTGHPPFNPHHPPAFMYNPPPGQSTYNPSYQNGFPYFHPPPPPPPQGARH